MIEFKNILCKQGNKTKMEIMSFIKKGMTYQPTENDPVLVFRNGGFGFNYLNKESRKGFWDNVAKCRGIKVQKKNLSSLKTNESTQG